MNSLRPNRFCGSLLTAPLLLASLAIGLLLRPEAVCAGPSVTLTKGDITSLSIGLQWRISSPQTVKSIAIYRSTSTATRYMQRIATASPGFTSYLDQTVNPGATYFYQIRLTTTQGDSTINSNLLRIATLATTATGRDIFVAPTGSSGNSGSIEQPLDIVTAISSRGPAKPGDTIWLRSGTYTAPDAVFHGTEEPTLISSLTGTANAPITLRQYPGERATIDGGLRVEGAWTFYRDFEITNSSPIRTQKRPMGLHIFGANTKFINLVIHDCGNGIGFWQPAENAEIYGAILYHNGWEEVNDYRGHGHGIYAQNLTGTKSIIDVISFDNYATGMKAYTEHGYANNIRFEGNISFNNGSPARPQPAYNRVENILVGASVNPVEGISLVSNYTYHIPRSTGNSIFLGYAAASNRDITLRDNYFVSGASNHTFITRWQNVIFTGNTFIGLRDLLVLQMPAGLNFSAYRNWDGNSYFSRTSPLPFIYADESIHGGYRSLAQWRTLTGFDQNSNWLLGANGHLTGVKIFLRPNRYEQGRANIAIYNWDMLDTVQVDLSAILKQGDRFEVRNAQDFFGQPVASGVFSGDPVAIPMTGTATGPEFNAFIVIKL